MHIGAPRAARRGRGEITAALYTAPETAPEDDAEDGANNAGENTKPV